MIVYKYIQANISKTKTNYENLFLQVDIHCKS